jgi:type IV pilus assembly protein PilB
VVSARPSSSSGSRVRPRLGEILIELGLINETTLARVLEEQAASGHRLGDELLNQRLVQPRDLVRAIASQLGFEYVDLEDTHIDLTLAQQLPTTLARRLQAVPIGMDDGQIVVAMSNPADVVAVDDLQVVLRHEIHPVMAETGQINDLIERSSQGDQQVAQALSEASVKVVGETELLQAAADAENASFEDAPIVRYVELLLSKAVRERASDVHIEPTEAGTRVRFRVDGVLREELRPPKQLHMGLISRIKVMAGVDIAERRLPQDGRASIEVGGKIVDLRVATMPTIHGESAALRLLPRGTKPIGLSELDFLPEQLARFLEVIKKTSGAILVTGPTGSGKSTTLYATLQELNDPTRNILTVEDPVEYHMAGIKQVQVHPRAGLTFAVALRAFLRADPDVILVGEIRDIETAVIAMEASLTGHQVLSTLHTINTSAAPLRLMEMGVEPFMVISAVQTILAQRLCRRLCLRCREAATATPAEIAAVGIPEFLLDHDGNFPMFRPVGCSACGRSGYRGRFAIHELLVINEEIAQLAIARAPATTIEALAVQQGMWTLKEDGLRKVAAGMTSLQELLRVVA